jgi:hypothetical protein
VLVQHVWSNVVVFTNQVDCENQMVCINQVVCTNQGVFGNQMVCINQWNSPHEIISFVWDRLGFWMISIKII